MLNKLENIIKFFPLIFILLTTLGYIHLQTYYYYFNIDILNYLDITEIILLFFNKSILLTLGIISVVVVSYVLDYKITNETDEKKEIPNTKPINKRSLYFGTFIILSLIGYVLLLLIRENYIGLIYPIGYTIGAIIYFILEKYVFKILFTHQSAFFSISTVISIVALFLINLITITYSIEKGYYIRYKNQVLKQISFSYNKETIHTTNNVKYIGETKSNLFLYDSNKKETIIYKMENIDNIIIKIN
jgi:hypothetical protein